MTQKEAHHTSPGALRKRTLVVAALVQEEGRVLLTQRRADQPMGGLWELPGGKVEPGEDPVVALAREVSEELGCQARVGRIDDVIFYRYPEFDLLMLVYAVEIVGEPRAVEVAALAWVPPERLRDYQVLPADEPLIARLAAEAGPISAK